ncbi:ArnT family glycosyltransferase [Streptomyces sp. NPDC048441]|uniref:ArnT family glycosyltransferase n=1 Tax=Streptomyces sp. NPDC048441 TaxID=3365552 RepID=UPI003718CCCE
MTVTASSPPLLPRSSDARWVRPVLIGLLAAVGLAYIWNLSASGYANSFYSGAVQAGSESWKAFLFGSSDAANAITVDKAPAALWPMALSVRLFGLGSWQILLPQVLMAVATAGVLYAAVRRRFTAAAGLIAVAVFATAPVAALMFRFNNPDALLALLMTVTVYCVLRALEDVRTKWLVWAGVAVGFAFLTKSLQAFLILPPLALLYGVCAPTSVRRRLGQLALSGLAVVVSGGWWVALVELWPASSRPYIGGSQNNSFLELTFGYNGIGRIKGDEAGNAGGGWSSGETGIGRLVGGNIGGQVTWLLPAALVLLVTGLVVTRRAGRTDTARAAFLAWGGSLLMTAVVFSFMKGMFHAYYTVALAPYIAALVGMGAAALWEERGRFLASAVLGGTVAVTAIWSYVLLGRSAGYVPWLRWAVLAGGLVAALVLPLAGRLRHRLGHQLTLGAAGLGLAASLAGPLAYTVTTLGDGHVGSLVAAGPSVSGGGGGPGDMGGSGGMPEPDGAGGQEAMGGTIPVGGPNGPGGAKQPPRMASAPQQGGQAQSPSQTPARTQPQGEDGGGIGDLLNGVTVSDMAKAELLADADDYTWAAAGIGAQITASYQLATERPVMSIGGYIGTDPSPTLAQFKQYVADGEIHYFVGGSQGADPGGGISSQISAWVTSGFEKVTVDGTTLYDLTQPSKER